MWKVAWLHVTTTSQVLRSVRRSRWVDDSWCRCSSHTRPLWHVHRQHMLRRGHIVILRVIWTSNGDFTNNHRDRFIAPFTQRMQSSQWLPEQPLKTILFTKSQITWNSSLFSDFLLLGLLSSPLRILLLLLLVLYCVPSLSSSFFYDARMHLYLLYYPELTGIVWLPPLTKWWWIIMTVHNRLDTDDEVRLPN